MAVAAILLAAMPLCARDDMDGFVKSYPRVVSAITKREITVVDKTV